MTPHTLRYGSIGAEAAEQLRHDRLRQMRLCAAGGPGVIKKRAELRNMTASQLRLEVAS